MLLILRPDDIVETNTFRNDYRMADYHLEDIVYELNESAKIAREVAMNGQLKSDKPRFGQRLFQQTEQQVCHQM
jgi:methionine synthase I (cobalamin-dependent)